MSPRAVAIELGDHSDRMNVTTDGFFIRNFDSVNGTLCALTTSGNAGRHSILNADRSGRRHTVSIRDQAGQPRHDSGEQEQDCDAHDL